VTYGRHEKKEGKEGKSCEKPAGKEDSSKEVTRPEQKKSWEEGRSKEAGAPVKMHRPWESVEKRKRGEKVWNRGRIRRRAGTIH